MGYKPNPAKQQEADDNISTSSLTHLQYHSYDIITALTDGVRCVDTELIFTSNCLPPLLEIAEHWLSSHC